MSQVRVWHEILEIPTYPVGRPDPNPMFLDRRVYQGSSGKVYPHPVTDTFDGEKTLKPYHALFLENDYLRIMVLPELGGRVQRALDKTNGYDFVYYNRVIKPAMVGLAGPWVSGGIEFNWPQHHRPSTFDPVPWKTVENPDGSCSILVGEIEEIFRTKGMTRFTLYPDRAYLEITNQLYNRTDVPQTFLWWANPAVAVNDHTRSVFPPDVNAVMDHGKRDVSAFPIARGVYYKQDYSAGVDISRYRNIPVPTSYMAAHSDYDFVGNYDEAKQAGMLHIADHHISPGKKQWTWGNGEFGQAWDRNLTDEDGPYIELMAGCFTDNQPDFSWLMPGEEKRFTQYFMPYKEVERVCCANEQIVLGLTRSRGAATLSVYVSESLPKCTLRLSLGEKVLGEKEADLSPMHAASLTVPEEKGRISCTVLDAEGRVLLSWQEEEEKEVPLPSPAEPIPAPEKVESTEKLLRYGIHLLQYRHATWDPMAYFDEGLRREPDHVRLLTEKAKLLMKMGLPEEAAALLKRAACAAQEKNPNPYDGECFYLLGVALSMLGEETAAYDAFFKATWNSAWKSSAFERIGCMDLKVGNVKSALEHLTQAVDSGFRNLRTRDALAFALLRAGKKAEAEACFRENLSLDPMDALSAIKLGASPENVLGEMSAPWLEVALECERIGETELAAQLLDAGFRKTGAVLLAVHLAALTEDKALLLGLHDSPPCICFPHRWEDHVALRKAMTLDPEGFLPFYADGNYLYAAGNRDAAIRTWEEAARLRPDFPQTHRNLAIAAFNHLQDSERALREMEAAFRADPSDARILMELDHLSGMLHQSARERLQRLEEHAALLDIRDDLAVAYAALLNLAGRHKEALQWIDSRTFHPWEGGEGKVPAQWKAALLSLAREEMARGDFQSAEERLRLASGPYPHHLGEGRLPSCSEHEVLLYLGDCLKAQGRDTEAKAAYVRAAAGGSEIASVLYYNDDPPERIAFQGLALRALGRETEALVRFDALIAYADKHMADIVRNEYFAVSLPDLTVFNEDLTARNRVRCLVLHALGCLGRRDEAAFQRDLSRLREIAPTLPDLSLTLLPLAKREGLA